MGLFISPRALVPRLPMRLSAREQAPHDQRDIARVAGVRPPNNGFEKLTPLVVALSEPSLLVGSAFSAKGDWRFGVECERSFKIEAECAVQTRERYRCAVLG
jgi:hypothetical protein